MDYINMKKKGVIMKRAVVVLITLALFSLCNGDDRNTPAYETMEEFGSQVFEFIQSDKFNKILELRPDLNEFTAIINNSSFPDAQKKEIIREGEYTLKKGTEFLKKSYDLFIEESESARIDWSNYSLDYIDYKHTNRNKLEIADIYLYINFQGGKYKISLFDCFRTESTWLIGDEINWKVSK
jgi:hypothetical protein